MGAGQAAAAHPTLTHLVQVWANSQAAAHPTLTHLVQAADDQADQQIDQD